MCSIFLNLQSKYSDIVFYWLGLWDIVPIEKASSTHVMYAQSVDTENGWL